eukprot:4359740-Pyramimonas_sp.AAC.1
MGTVTICDGDGIGGMMTMLTTSGDVDVDRRRRHHIKWDPSVDVDRRRRHDRYGDGVVGGPIDL